MRPLCGHFSRYLAPLLFCAMLFLCGCQQDSNLIDPSPAADGQAIRLVRQGEAVSHKEVKFNEEMDSLAGKTVIVDFWAKWCGPCVMLAPELQKVALESGDDVVVLKVDVDSEHQLASHFHVSSIPDIRIFRDGKATGRIVGFHTAAEIMEKTR